MKIEIPLSDKTKLVMTKDEFGYQEVLDKLENAEFMRVITYNIKNESSDLLKAIEKFDETKDVMVISNIPGRFEKYTSQYAKKRAQDNIIKYIEALKPEKFTADFSAFFNFGNHSKIIMTNEIAYIGSANYSDASKNNNECGVIISDIEIIKEIEQQFICTLRDESVPYYSSTYIQVLSNVAAMVTKMELLSEDFYWSFYADSDHPHRDSGDHYRSFDANLSPILVEDFISLFDEIEEKIEAYVEDGPYNDIFEKFPLEMNSSLRSYFEPLSDLEMFSRFDVTDRMYNLFDKYMSEPNDESVDYHSQRANDKAFEELYDKVDQIYEHVKEVLVALKRYNSVLRNQLVQVESKKDISIEIDNTK